MRTIFPFVLGLGAASAGLTGQTCVPSAPYQAFTPNPDGTLSSGGACLTAASWPPVSGQGTALAMAACVSPPPPTQRFTLTHATGANAISLVATAAPGNCVNLAGYGTSPGTQAWLFACTPQDCKGNCAWAAGAAPGSLLNPASALCLDSGAEPPPPPAPATCAPGSPSVDLPFCNAALPVGARVEDLWGRLSEDQRLGLFSIPIQPNAYDPALNLKSVFWDITCIAGLSPGRLEPQPNATVFPNTIGQAASFDTDLVSRIGRATAEEGRIVNQLNGRLSGGRTWQGVLCDGGPLANTAHDPRWGRTSECVGFLRLPRARAPL